MLAVSLHASLPAFPAGPTPALAPVTFPQRSAPPPPATCRTQSSQINPPSNAVLLVEHAAWSQVPEHALLAAEWCRECVQPGGSAADALGASRLASADGGGGGGALEAAAQAQLQAARVLSGAGRPLSQPRARY